MKPVAFQRSLLLARVNGRKAARSMGVQQSNWKWQIELRIVLA
jgi:ribosomal protein S14